MERFFNRLNTVVILTLIICLSALTGISAETIGTPGITDSGSGMEQTAEEDVARILAGTNIGYEAHVQSIGWQPSVAGGQTAGTVGEGLSIEALKISLGNSLGANTGSVEYSVHCQSIGWTDTVRDGELAGTTGRDLNVQAVTAKLTGPISESYDIYYRVHSAYYGWLDWAKDGEVAGTTGLDVRAEAIEMQLVRKDNPAPGATDRPYINYDILANNAKVEYASFVGDSWQGSVSNGAESGTTGQNLPIRGLSVNTPNKINDSSIEYQCYFSNVGWMPTTYSNGDAASANGQQLEAVAIALKGVDDFSYDLYYNVSVQDVGWLGWASDGQVAGSSNGGKAIEAIHIMILPRGSAAPQPYGNSFVDLTPPDYWRWPLDGIGLGNVSSGFGYRSGGMHDGVDILAPQGHPITACKSGTVIVAGWYFGYGQCVVVVNDTGEKVYYAHMSQIGTTVGARVTQGQLIGLVGMTGNATANHLHLGVVVGGSWIDPLGLF